MLTIRLQRTGRSGTAMFRVVVQDSRQTPTSGKVVKLLGNYDPHAKTVHVDKEQAAFYLEHGAQPSPRVARLLKEQGVTLPGWVEASTSKQGKLKNTDKLRRNRPAEAVPAAPVAVPQEAAKPEEAPTELTAEAAPETPTAEAETPAEEA